MSMRVIEQIAMRTADIGMRIQRLGPINTFDGGHVVNEWVHDTVHAVHIYLHPNYTREVAGSAFSVQLAFNYSIIPGKELELIQLLSGLTVQLPTARALASNNEGLSHFGYHISDDDSLLDELQWWNQQGKIVTQVSLTTDHSGTSKRYMYGFIDTRDQIGVYTKVISRVHEHPSTSLDALITMYGRHVNR